MDDFSLRMLQLKKDGFCCSQMMLILALEAQGRSNVGLVRAAGGLCYGVGTGREVCGALSGGSCLLSLYAGKGTSEEQVDERFHPMVTELAQWFREAHGVEGGGVGCNDILTVHPGGSACGEIVATTFSKAMEIVMAHGLDPSAGREG